MNRVYNIQFSDLKITIAQIERFMGYSEENAPEPYPKIIEEVLEKANNLCQISGGYYIFDDIAVDKIAETICIDDINFYSGKIVCNQLQKSEKIAVFVCTAGKKIGNWSKELMNEGDLMKGYIVDVVGSETVETAMDMIQNKIEEELLVKELSITNRYSPGYCGWNVSEQHKLFSLLPVGFCGIHLSASALMEPIKSVSGFIGVGAEVKKNDYNCNLCSDKNCIYRNKRIINKKTN